jgi:hypothetical protein
MSYETESNYSSWAVGWADFGASRQWTDPRNTAPQPCTSTRPWPIVRFDRPEPAQSSRSSADDRPAHDRHVRSTGRREAPARNRGPERPSAPHFRRTVVVHRPFEAPHNATTIRDRSLGHHRDYRVQHGSFMI